MLDFFNSSLNPSDSENKIGFESKNYFFAKYYFVKKVYFWMIYTFKSLLSYLFLVNQNINFLFLDG